MSLANEANQRGLKDFLTLYNTITEYCFNKCVSNFNERNTSTPENACINICTDNYVQFNQRFMFNFVDQQERRKRELEITAREEAAKEAAKAAAEAQQNSNDVSDANNVVTSTTMEHPEASLTDTSGDILQQPQLQQSENVS